MEHGVGRSEVMNMAEPVHGKDSLENLNDALHDLYFEIPPNGFTPIDGKISIEFWDRDHVIDPVRTTRYRLTINRVVSCDNRGDLRVLPGLEAELNVIKFDPPKKRLGLIGVHPYELRCQVEELCVELLETASP